MTLGLNIYFIYAVAAVLGIFATARLTRLLTQDEFPPSVWLRIRWQTLTKDGSWAKLATCPWCASPYIAAIILLWGVLSELHWSWWLFCGWLSMSYVASWVVIHDED